jgi:hypothetical protein
MVVSYPPSLVAVFVAVPDSFACLAPSIDIYEHGFL